MESKRIRLDSGRQYWTTLIEVNAKVKVTRSQTEIELHILLLGHFAMFRQLFRGSCSSSNQYYKRV